MNYSKLIGALFLPVIFEICSRLASNFYMPSLVKIILDCYNSLDFGHVINTIWVSVFSTVLCFLVGNVLGFVAGVIFSYSKILIGLSEFSIDFMRSLPSITVFPLFMIMFGINQFSKNATVTFGIFWIVFFTIVNSVQAVSEVKVQYLKIHGANQFDVFRHYIMFVMYKNWVTMLGITLSLSLFVTLSVEMFVGSDNGIGKAIIDSKNYFEISQMYFWIFVTGMIGFLLNKSIAKLTKFFG
jgi:NitT/TauT family transport system permease protein